MGVHRQAPSLRHFGFRLSDRIGAETREGPEETGRGNGHGIGIGLRKRRRFVLREAAGGGERDRPDRPVRRVQVPHPVRWPDPRVQLSGLHRWQERPATRRLPPLLHCSR